MAIVSTNLKKQLILDVPFAYVIWKQAPPSSRVDKQSLAHFRKKLDNLLALADLVWGEHRDYQDDITLADQGNVFVNVYFT